MIYSYNRHVLFHPKMDADTTAADGRPIHPQVRLGRSKNM